MSTVIFDKRIENVARVWVFDHGDGGGQREVGRYSILKIMRLCNGKTARKSKYYKQKPAAIRYAEKWVSARVEVLQNSSTEQTKLEQLYAAVLWWMTRGQA